MKIKAQIDGKTVELDHSEVEVSGGQLLAEGEAPDGYVSKDFMQSEVQRRLNGKVSKDDLLQDEDFFRTAAERRGIEIDAEGRPAHSEEVDVESLKARWERDKLQPLQEQLEEMESTTQSLRGTTKKMGVLQGASSTGVKSKFLGEDTDFLGWHASKFGVEPETGEVALKEGEGFALSAKPEEGSRYVTPDEYFQNLRNDGTYSEFFEDKRPGASGLGDANGSGGRTFTSSELGSMSEREYAQNRDEILKARREGRIVQD